MKELAKLRDEQGLMAESEQIIQRSDLSSKTCQKALYASICTTKDRTEITLCYIPL